MLIFDYLVSLMAGCKHLSLESDEITQALQVSR
jgi:hypothetical protein